MLLDELLLTLEELLTTEELLLLMLEDELLTTEELDLPPELDEPVQKSLLEWYRSFVAVDTPPFPSFTVRVTV